MAIAMIFTVPIDTRQYDEVLKQLEDAGVAVPPGLLHHVCFATGTSLRVVDVWESQDAFTTFSQSLLPILQQMGIDLGQPDEVAEVHDIIKGSS